MGNSSKHKLLAILNLAGYLLVLVMNTLANAIPIAGKNTGELSDLYPNLFVPAGFTFSIWGIIYILLGIYVVTQLIYAFKQRNVEVIEMIGPWFLLSCIFNSSWILAWHYEQVFLSLVIMLGILVSLIMVYLRLGIGRDKVQNGERFLIQMPFSIYLGWISVATIANVTTLLVDQEWGGLGIPEAIWTVLVLVVATGLAVTMILTRKDLFYPLVTLWAFFGILSKRLGAPEVETAIVWTLYIGMGIVFLVLVYGLLLELKENAMEKRRNR